MEGKAMSALLVKSLNLGIIDTALNWLISAITTLLMWIVEWTLDLVIAIFAEILYGIGLTLLEFVDFFQAFFNALCGMGTYWDADGTKFVKEDPIISLITNETVLQTFLALTIVAVIMLFLTTLIAMIRTEFTTEGAKNTKGNIIGSAIKSLAMFFTVPAACVFGIQISCALLNTVYIATTGGSNASAGAMVWYAASYNANKLRNGEYTITEMKDKGLLSDFGIGSGADNPNSVALVVDNVFKSNSVVIKNNDLASKVDWSDLGLMAQASGESGSTKYYTYRSLELTKEFYNIRDMNFLVLFMGGGIAIYIMFIAAFGLIIRLYKCAILFIISAPISALTPLDGGNAYKSWRKLMIGAVCSAFAIVIAFNLVFLLIPIMSEINIFDPSIAVLQSWNRLVNTIFVLTGLYSIKETSKWVASMLGIEDPLAAGSEISGKVMGTVGKIGTAAGGLALSAAGKTMAKVASAKANRDEKKLSEALESGDEKAAAKARKSLDRSTSFAKGASGFAAKAQKTGTGVIAKSMGQKFQKLDDFMGGAKVLGGYDDEGNAVGLGGLATKAATGLYSGASTVTGALAGTALYAGGSAAAGAVKGAIAGGAAGVAHADYWTAHGKKGTGRKIAEGAGGGLIGSVAGTVAGLGAGFRDAFASPDGEFKYTKGADGKYHKTNKRTGEDTVINETEYKQHHGARGFFRNNIGGGFFGGANGISRGGNVLAGIVESEAHMKKVAEMMSQANKELADLLAKLTRGFKQVGADKIVGKNGEITQLGMDHFGEDLMKVLQYVPKVKTKDAQGNEVYEELTVDKLTAKLLGQDTTGLTAQQEAHNLQSEFKTTQKEFGDFYNANINMGGITVEMMPTALRDALQSVFSGLGVEGADFSSQFEEIKTKLKQEFEKQRAEAEKDRKQIAALAVAIAKYGKRLNPGK